ncbi:MAG: hypothetical protein Q8P05_03075 [Candidatus Diapherotrites archaeon]|nr:hypothetical protein [Candidatus Diapherotrites archaeon]MDZ4256357.1 hypothetical protein [archaeon]
MPRNKNAGNRADPKKGGSIPRLIKGGHPSSKLSTGKGLLLGGHWYPGLVEVRMPSGKIRYISRGAYERYVKKSRARNKTVGEMVAEALGDA